MISPFKAALGIDYKAFERGLETAIHLRFGLPPAPPAEIRALIKRADRVSAYHEAVELAGFAVTEARTLFGEPPQGYRPALAPLAAPPAQVRYLERFHSLSEACGAEVHDAAMDTE